MDYDGEWQGLPLDRYILPPAMPSDMLQSQCVLDHASTGKEGNSAKKKKKTFNKDRCLEEKTNKE